MYQFISMFKARFQLIVNIKIINLIVLYIRLEFLKCQFLRQLDETFFFCPDEGSKKARHN